MPLTLSGTLKDPYGNPLPGALIRFDSVVTSSDVLNHINAEASTDAEGAYAIQVEFGRYDIRVQQGRSFFELARNVLINADTSAETLNQLIVDAQSYDDLTPQIILEFIALRDETRGYRDEAAASADAAETSAEGVDQAAAAALASQQAAAESESNAADSATAAAESETNAAGSASAALASEKAAGQSETLAEQAATAAGDSQAAAAQSETNAASSEANAAGSASAALASEQSASGSEAAALASQQAAAESEGNAAASEANAAGSATAAATSESNAASSAVAASDSASAAATSEDNAAASETNAADSASAATLSEGNAAGSATAAATSASSAATSATEAADAAASIDAGDIVHAPGTGLPNEAGDIYSRAASEFDSAGTAAAAVAQHESKASAHTPVQVGADPAGTAASAMQAHEGAADPHDQYELKAALKSAAYSTVAEILDQVVPPVALTPAAFHKADGSRPAWSTPDGTTLETASDLSLVVGSNVVQIAAGTAVSLPALTVGTDYTIYADENGNLEAVAAGEPEIVNARVLGGFHASAGGAAIVVNSLWDLNWRPAAPNPRGMVFDNKRGNWVDIYLMHVAYGIDGYSRSGQQIADGNSPPIIPLSYGGNGVSTYSDFTWFNAVDLASSAGKYLPSYDEFSSHAFGVVEQQSVGTDPNTTQHQAGHRSAIGCEQITGVLWQWGRNINGTSATGSGSWQEITGGRGSVYMHSLRAVLLGADWYSGSNSGSRASSWGYSPSNSNGSVSARAACDHLNLQRAA